MFLFVLVSWGTNEERFSVDFFPQLNLLEKKNGGWIKRQYKTLLVFSQKIVTSYADDFALIICNTNYA